LSVNQSGTNHNRYMWTCDSEGAVQTFLHELWSRNKKL